MSEVITKFSCGACGRKHNWKKELAGRQGKCKCGQVITVPTEPDNEDFGEYDLADAVADAERAAARMPPTIIDVAPPPPRPASSSKPAKSKPVPASPQINRRDDDVLVDRNRDLIVPSVLTVVGATLYVAYYINHYHLGFDAVGSLILGLGLIAVLETGLLIGFALAVAGPLNVGFGDVRFAVGKFAGLAIFCDGVTVWVDGFVSKYAGGFGSGIFGFGVLGLPVAFAIYWVGMGYLFGLDPGESSLVVTILTVFYRIVRTILVVLLLSVVLGHAGISRSDTGIPTFGPGAPPNPMVDEMEQAKQSNHLVEARDFATKTFRSAAIPSIDAWYAAGAKNVYYEVDRDINGRATPFQVVVELPTDAAARAKCYQIAKNWCDNFRMSFASESLHDTGDPYLTVPVP
jgi:hypothetical protein